MSDIINSVCLMQYQVLFLSMHVDLVKSHNGKSQQILLDIGVKCMCAWWSLMVTVLSVLLQLQSFILDLEKGKM
jgi:hypothetical protein